MEIHIATPVGRFGVEKTQPNSAFGFVGIVEEKPINCASSTKDCPGLDWTDHERAAARNNE
jgi:hypothetical protein